MMHSWQTLLLLIAAPLLILSILSFLGQLIRLLPYVFLIVFGFGGIALILDSSSRGGFLGTIELILGGLLTIISVINLYLIISSHRHDLAVLQSRQPRTPIRNIVLETIEKPKFGNPNNTKSQSKHKSKKTLSKSSQLASLSPKPSKRSAQF